MRTVSAAYWDNYDWDRQEHLSDFSASRYKQVRLQVHDPISALLVLQNPEGETGKEYLVGTVGDSQILRER